MQVAVDKEVVKEQQEEQNVEQVPTITIATISITWSGPTQIP